MIFEIHRIVHESCLINAETQAEADILGAAVAEERLSPSVEQEGWMWSGSEFLEATPCPEMTRGTRE